MVSILVRALSAAWPAHWRFDTYDLAPHLRRGDNTLAVLVNHFGEGDFQYIAGPPGLLASLHLDGQTVLSDGTWQASADPAFVSDVPRISCQEAFEEQFDARQSDGWTAPAYDDSAWPAAQVLRPAADGWHQDLQPAVSHS